MDFRFKLRTVNVPESLTHKTAKEEIERLPEYVEVTSTAADGLVMLYKSVSKPPLSMRGHIWCKISAAGEPLGCYLYNNAAWVAIPVGS